jgi:hypothetical protein
MSTSLRAVCLYDFSSRQRDELSIHKGKKVHILHGPQTDDDWWLVKAEGGKGLQGLVPCNYLRILPIDAIVTPSHSPNDPSNQNGSLSLFAHKEDIHIESEAETEAEVGPGPGDRNRDDSLPMQGQGKT